MVQSARLKGSTGEKLSNPFPSLKDRDVNLIRGQFVLVAAAPGTGKSALMLSWALKSGVPFLYFSADSDNVIQASRAISILENIPLEESVNMILNDDLEDVITDLADSPGRFNFRASPTVEDIELSMQSYDEVYGDYPALVIVDNITDVDNFTDDGSGGGLEPLCAYLNSMAREAEACVVGMHHVTGPYNDGDKPVPQSGIKEQIGRVPAMMLTVWKQLGEEWGDDLMFVTDVKNRNGKPDPTAQNPVVLKFDGKCMQITERSAEDRGF